MDEDVKAQSAPIIRRFAKTMVEVMITGAAGPVPLELVMEMHDRLTAEYSLDEDDRQALREIFRRAAIERLSQ